MANMLRALEAHVALFGMFDDPATEATIKKAIDKQKVPEMSKKKLARKERDNLPDSAFGLPKMRKYPLTDPDRVKNAIKYFKFCGKENRAELAKNIEKAAKKFKIEIVVTRGNPIADYIKGVKEVAPKKKPGPNPKK